MFLVHNHCSVQPYGGRRPNIVDWSVALPKWMVHRFCENTTKYLVMSVRPLKNVGRKD